MRKLTPLLRLVPLALLLAGASALADENMTKLTIQVKTQTGRPVDRAEVVVNFMEGRSIIKLGKAIRTSYDLRTNQEGEARIPAIPQGKIKISVNAKGYQTFGETIEVKEEEKVIEIKLNAPQPQYSAH
jgi:hypothetical protein